MSTERELGRLAGAVEALTAEVRTGRNEHRQDVKDIHERIDLQQTHVNSLEKQVTDHKGEHRGKKIMLVGGSGAIGGAFVELVRYLKSFGGGS